MCLFKLIAAKRFSEFCEIYEKNAQFSAANPEFADLIPGNYVKALLGCKNYKKAMDFSLEQILKNQSPKKKYDRSSSSFYIACSIAKMQLHHDDALKILYDGRKAKYQDISRTEVPCIMYYEAVMLNDEIAKKQSLELLKKSLKNNRDSSYEFSLAQFIIGKYTEEELMQKISTIPPTLLERYQVKALFYAAVKEYEKGNIERYKDLLCRIESLYCKQPFIVIEWEYLLSVICRENEEGKEDKSK